MEKYVRSTELDAVNDAILNSIGYGSDVRQVLLEGLPLRFAAILPGGAGGIIPLIALRLDLGSLNNAGRLVDGTIPLKILLQNVLKLAGTREDLDPVREAVAEIEARSTGARVEIAQAVVVQEKLVLADDMVSYRFMEVGVEAAHAVAKLTVPRYEGGAAKMNGANAVTYLGTGSVVGKGLLLTNHHVINARDDREPPAGDADVHTQAKATTVLFDYDADSRQGTQSSVLQLVAWNATLDYALLRINDKGRKPLALATAPIEKKDDNTAIPVNIIQHPDGKPKRFGIRNNLVTEATEIELRYFTDTLTGSSGSPVMNDNWEFVALHRGAAFVKGVKFQGREVPYVNVGTQLSAVLADLRRRYSGKIPELAI
jgi:endonuclease G